MVMQVKLGNGGLCALVDDEDYTLVSQYNWCAFRPSQSQVTYAVRWISSRGGLPRRRQSMHQLIMGMRGIDHEDHDGLNNQRSNLRPANQSQNNQNARKQARPCSSRFKGVSWHKRMGKWRAYIKLPDGRRASLGYYRDEIEAARAYDAAALEHFGRFACVNFPA